MDFKHHHHLKKTKTQQRMYFLHQLRKLNPHQDLLLQFHTAVSHSGFGNPITVWFGSDTKHYRNRLKQTVRRAVKITGAKLPSIQDIYTSRIRKWAEGITAEPSPPGHNLDTICLNSVENILVWM